MSDIIEQIRSAFDGDSVPLKNIALRKAHDEIEHLKAERAGDQHRLFHYEVEIARLQSCLHARRSQTSKGEDEMTEPFGHEPLRNGEVWKQPAFPNFEVVTQWMDGDEWMLLTAPYKARHGGVAMMPTGVVGGDGSMFFYTSEDLLKRLRAHHFTPTNKDFVGNTLKEQPND